ncbi:hypothetical protein [Micromonospora mirobrigensis]|uniref:PknH-like extracellular domain-containing protein n=1 Tax=Micromonospora mirobrigensis TaxID=262898 RepID=A0A1C4Z5W7_9ACTN|nr:hypothetical protein [Micromonospora mirobrigensis]SCF28378.1 hypothetical protein GA0070564_105107 [Micromonospora mirobrigensis]
MSDGFERGFESLRGQQPPAPFANPSAVRRRGRQRARHQALAAGLAVVAVVGVGFGWAANVRPVGNPVTPAPAATSTTAAPLTAPPTDPPSLAPTVSGAPEPKPSRPFVPSPEPDAGPPHRAGLLLRPNDLGPGDWIERAPQEPFEGDTWRWADLCPAYRSADYPSLRHQADVDLTGYAAGRSYVYEHLHRYADGWGKRAYADVMAALTRCGATAAPKTPPRPPSVEPGGVAPTTYTILESGPLGNQAGGGEAILVREEQWGYDGDVPAKEPFVTLTAVVRVGDLVATLMFSPDRDQKYVNRVVRTTATRLTAG